MDWLGASTEAQGSVTTWWRNQSRAVTSIYCRFFLVSSMFWSFFSFYCGAGDGDANGCFCAPILGGNTGPTYETFWKKFLVAGTLQKWDTDAKLLVNLPLFLEDEAFLVWDELSDEDKKDRAKVYAAMQAAFSLSPAEAYELFTARTLRMDESVDS